MQSPSITQPSGGQIEKWWKWAAGFSHSNGPFRVQLGTEFDRIPQPQPLMVFCLSCTAGSGGVDPKPRPLAAALRSGVPVLVPVFVGSSYADENSSISLIDQARNIVGTVDADGNPSSPNVFLKIDGVAITPFKVEQEVDSVTFVKDNNFDMREGTYNIATVGYWALITPPISVKSIEFGGRGGHISDQDMNTFETGVIYAS